MRERRGAAAHARPCGVQEARARRSESERERRLEAHEAPSRTRMIKRSSAEKVGLDAALQNRARHAERVARALRRSRAPWRATLCASAGTKVRRGDARAAGGAPSASAIWRLRPAAGSTSPLPPVAAAARPPRRRPRGAQRRPRASALTPLRPLAATPEPTAPAAARPARDPPPRARCVGGADGRDLPRSARAVVEDGRAARRSLRADASRTPLGCAAPPRARSARCGTGMRRGEAEREVELRQHVVAERVAQRGRCFTRRNVCELGMISLRPSTTPLTAALAAGR